MAVGAIEHSFFKNYSVALGKWIQKSVFLHRYPRDNNVTVVYSTPDRAWAEYIYPTFNGGTLSPNINFHLEEMEYIEGENNLGFVTENKRIIENGVEKFIKVFAPLIYKLTYSATFFTRTQDELDILFFQLISKAHKNKKAVTKVDGQWAEIWANSPVNETELSPSGTEDTVRRGRINFVIERAYLPLQVQEIQEIQNVSLDYVINQINGEIL